MEEYRDIKGYEGIYQVSNLGNVKSLERTIERATGNMVIKEKILSTKVNKGDYARVALHKDKKSKRFRVHQLVAMAFLNHKPDGFKMVVDHINNVKTDNRVENIQVISHRMNVSKDRKAGTSKYTGVSWNKRRGKWKSVIRINDKEISLGEFDSEIKASNAYQEALITHSKGEEIKRNVRKVSSKYKGVSWANNIKKWRACIYLNGKNKSLGSFIKEEDANLAYQKELKKLKLELL